MKNSNQATLPQILAEGQWLHGLALYLAQDRADADDMVQETWLAALRAAPDTRQPMRPWLAQVLRNARHQVWRGDARRRRRELDASALVHSEPVPSTETMLARLELQRLVSAVVRDLDEPYRTALLLRFIEGRSPTDIARDLGIPAGTVRWRLNEGLQRVRARLDEAHGGNRETWKAALVLPPLAVPAAGAPAAPAPASTGTVPGVGLVARIAGVALVPAVGTALLLGWGRGPNATRALEKPAASPARPAETAAAGARATAANRLFGAAVPALIAAADASPAAAAAAVPVCDPSDPDCVPRIPRDQLPPAAEATLTRILAGRTPERLRIEPRQRKGHSTFKVRYEMNGGIDEELDVAEDGTFIEQQIQVMPGDLPDAINRAASAAVPGATVLNADLNNEGDFSYYQLVDGLRQGPLQHRSASRYYAIKVRAGSEVHDLKIAEDGKVLEDKLR